MLPIQAPHKLWLSKWTRFSHVNGVAESERGLRRNRAAFETICFEPWRLLDVSQRDLSIELFGRTQPMPLVIAPTGLNGALWPDGDVLLAEEPPVLLAEPVHAVASRPDLLGAADAGGEVDLQVRANSTSGDIQLVRSQKASA